MAVFNLIKVSSNVNKSQFYEFKSKNETNLLDFSSVLYGKNFQIPSFKKIPRPIKFLVSNKNYEHITSVFITKPDVAILFLKSVQRIYVSKPVFHQILLIYEEFKRLQVSYEDEEIELNSRIVDVNDALIDQFKNKTIFVSYNEVLSACDFSFMPIATGAKLGWVNYKFVLKNKKTVLYVTSETSKVKFYKKSKDVQADFVLINKVEEKIFIKEFEIKQVEKEPLHFTVVKNRKLDLDEFVRKHEIEDVEMVEKFDFYADTHQEKVVEKKVEKEETPREEVDQLDKFTELIKAVTKDFEKTLIVQFSLIENFIDVSMHILSLIERSSVQFFVNSDLFNDLFSQINNQIEWLNFEPEGEPFPIKSYQHFKVLPNLNTDFNKKHKIIFVNNYTKIFEISPNQIVATINAKEEKVDLKNCFNFYIKFESSVKDIQQNHKEQNVFTNVENLKVEETVEFDHLMLNEHLHLYKNNLFLCGNLKITDFFTKNKISLIFDLQENLISEMSRKEEFYAVKNSLIFPQSGIKFEILENGQVKSVNLNDQ